MKIATEMRYFLLRQGGPASGRLTGGNCMDKLGVTNMSGHSLTAKTEGSLTLSLDE